MKTFKQIQQTDLVVTIGIVIVVALISFYIGMMVSDIMTLDRYTEVSKTEITQGDVYYVATGEKK